MNCLNQAQNQKKSAQNFSSQIIQCQYEHGGEYQWKNNISEMFASLNHISKQMFQQIINMLKKEKSIDCIDFLSNHITAELSSDSSPADNIWNSIKTLTNILNNISQIDFNKKNFLSEEFVETRKNLISQISQNEKIVQFLKFLVHLTAIDSRFVQCGSNSLNLLVELQEDLKNQSFEDIRIKDTSLIGANLCSLT